MLTPTWEREGVQLYLGDCLEILPHVKLPLGDTMILADPPYGMNLDTDFSGMPAWAAKATHGGNRHQRIIGDAEQYDPRPVMVAVPCLEQFWFGADYYAENIPGRNAGSWLVWDKRITESADKMFGSTFELIWSKHRRRREMLRIKWAGIFGMEKQDVRTRVHPAQKPLELLERLIGMTRCGTVLVPYAGSGSEMVAAIRCGRRAAGVEIKRDYFDIAVARIEKALAERKEQLAFKEGAA